MSHLLTCSDVAAARGSATMFLVLSLGLRGAEVRGRSVPDGDELPRSRPVGDEHEEVPTTAAGRRQHVHRVQTEGDDTTDGRQAGHLHG